MHVTEYKCPCCGAALKFGAEDQQMRCEYCENTFTLEAVQACQTSEPEQDTFDWSTSSAGWSQEEQGAMAGLSLPLLRRRAFDGSHHSSHLLPLLRKPRHSSRAGFRVLPPGPDHPLPAPAGGGSGGLPPLLYRQAPAPQALLDQPAAGASHRHVRSLLDLRLRRRGQGPLPGHPGQPLGRFPVQLHQNRPFPSAARRRPPMQGRAVDGSQKMDNTWMEAIEPYDYTQAVPFDMAYLSGYLADQYDVSSEACQPLPTPGSGPRRRPCWPVPPLALPRWYRKASLCKSMAGRCSICCCRSGCSTPPMMGVAIPL